MKTKTKTYFIASSLLASIILAIILPSLVVRIAFVLSLCVLFILWIGDLR